MLIGDVVAEDRSPTFLLGMGGLAEADSIPASLMCGSSTFRYSSNLNPTYRTALLSLTAAMDGRVTCRAESNQVLFGIFPRVAAKLQMMDFQVGHGAARLTAPAVSA